MEKQYGIQPGKSNMPVLIAIDDEEPILFSLQCLLRKDGYKMYFFSTCCEALEFLKENDADVILTDMRMPEMNGIQFLENPSVIELNAIKILLSGNEDKSIVFNAMSKGLAGYYILKPWDDEQLRTIVSESMKLQHELKQKKLQDILLSFKSLPSPPDLHSKLKTMLQKEKLSHKDIATEIEKSPALVAKLLRMSNSIFYGGRKPITNIFDALTFIGTEFVLNILFYLESFDSICSSVYPKAVHIVEEFTTSSIIRAQIAREISLNWHEKVDPQEAYIAGLMLEIGMLLRFCSNNEKLDLFFSEYSKGNKSLFELDAELFIITHDEVGEALLNYWNFSPGIVSAVANHHRFSGNNSLTTIVQIADTLVSGKDSYPHDPVVDKMAPEWELNLNDFLKTIKNLELI
ncbi:MAG: HDOD domain-containing protein [Ignavibacteriaceae bacterium]|jgi:HD-like signal output (HDOD) protein